MRVCVVPLSFTHRLYRPTNSCTIQHNMLTCLGLFTSTKNEGEYSGDITCCYLIIMSASIFLTLAQSFNKIEASIATTLPPLPPLIIRSDVDIFINLRHCPRAPHVSSSQSTYKEKKYTLHFFTAQQLQFYRYL